MFKWVQDHEGDIGLQLFYGLITLLKYKEHTIVLWFRRFANAPKYVRGE